MTGPGNVGRATMPRRALPEAEGSVAHDRLYFNPLRQAETDVWTGCRRLAAACVPAGGLIDNSGLWHYVEIGRSIRFGSAVAQPEYVAMAIRSPDRLAARSRGDMHVWIFGEKLVWFGD